MFVEKKNFLLTCLYKILIVASENVTSYNVSQYIIEWKENEIFPLFKLI